MNDALGRPGRVLLLGGTSEIGLEILAALNAPAETEVLLAGREPQRLEAAGKTLRYQVRTLPYDATALPTHQALIEDAFAGGDVDLVISAAGVLVPQEKLDADPLQGGQLIRLELNLKKLGALAGVSTVLLSHHVEMVTVASEKSKVAYRMEIELRLPNESSAHSVLSDLETLPGEEVRMVNSAEEA